MALGTRLFVGNLPVNTVEKDLHSAFSVFGNITNLDLKIKSGDANDSKKFAFVSISASNADVESCIKHFANEDFNGNRVYVTRARESFLERLQREREQTQKKDTEKHEPDILPKHNPVINLSDKLNPRKRKIDYNHSNDSHDTHKSIRTHKYNEHVPNLPAGDATSNKTFTEVDKKKHDSEKKRLESMRKKRQDFKEKQMIIKTGLIGIDKVQNRKVKFSDDGDDSLPKNVHLDNITLHRYNNKNALFDDEDENVNDDGLNFDIKKQFEGKKGQKVLDLQSRYKSDKRFTLDERFIDDDDEDGTIKEQSNENGETEIDMVDEKAKQLSILQDVLGVTIRTRVTDQDSKKTKPKLGMLRFDPMQPDHAKFLATVETKQAPTKKSKKKSKETMDEIEEPIKPEGPKIDVSKEQFYKVSETLKEAIAQPNTFSLRSLFGNNEEEGPQEQESDYIPLEAPKVKKVKNPLDPKERNPFVYDSSDSETEEVEDKIKTDLPATNEPKAVWKEKLFFSMQDQRLTEGLSFFSKRPENEGLKERRELKSLMKKRIYNKDRKNQMFQKKIGGRKKSMKKPYKNKI